MNFRLTFLTISACCLIAEIPAKADFLTLSVTNNTASFDVPTNVLAQVIYMYGPSSYTVLQVKIRDRTASYLPDNYYAIANGSVRNLPMVAGPATISLSSTNAFAYCTIQTTAPTTGTFTPSTAVVIPNDNGGPVTIILESSTDLANWTSALPGTYGTTSTNRFFRVRATR
jgi:hypothetical protein